MHNCEDRLELSVTRLIAENGHCWADPLHRESVEWAFNHTEVRRLFPFPRQGSLVPGVWNEDGPCAFRAIARFLVVEMSPLEREECSISTIERDDNPPSPFPSRAVVQLVAFYLVVR